MDKIRHIALTTGLISAILLGGQPASALAASPNPSAPPPGIVLPDSNDDFSISIGDKTYEPTGGMSKNGLAAPGCSADDPESKRVTNWQRRNPAGVAKLVCGTAGYGWRHIAQRHGQDYQNIVNKYQLGQSWQDFAKWAMSTTVGAPQSAPVNTSNNTWSYTAPIQIRNKQGQVVRTYSMLVAISRSDEKIITAYPR